MCGLVQPVQHGGRAGRGGQGLGQRLQRRRDGAGTVIEQPGGRPGRRARVAEPLARRAGAMPASVAAPQAGEIPGDPGAVPADPHAVAQAGQQPGPAVPQPGQVAGRRPAPRSGTGGTGSPSGNEAAGYPWCPHRAQVRFFAGGSRPGTQLGAGRAQRVQVGDAVLAAAAGRRRLRPGRSRARVAISCAGVTSKMSHSAASTGSDSRSGVWVTSRHTCTDGQA